MIGFKVNGFIALVLVAPSSDLPRDGCTGRPALYTNGIGSTLGGLAMILGFGAMLGKLISDTGCGTTYRHYADCYFW